MSKLNEEWRPVVGYEGLYEVSDWGRVKSLDRVVDQYNCRAKRVCKRRFKGRIMKKTINCQGYEVVTLTDPNHIQKEGKVHILVAKAFLPNPHNKKEVGHTKTLDNGLEDKTANEAWNIQWMTREENANYGTLPQRLSEMRIGERNPNYGKHPSQETLDRMSIAHKGLLAGEKNPMFGKHTNNHKKIR